MCLFCEINYFEVFHSVKTTTTYFSINFIYPTQTKTKPPTQPYQPYLSSYNNCVPSFAKLFNSSNFCPNFPIFKRKIWKNKKLSKKNPGNLDKKSFDKNGPNSRQLLLRGNLFHPSRTPHKPKPTPNQR